LHLIKHSTLHLFFTGPNDGTSSPPPKELHVLFIVPTWRYLEDREMIA
jgi:hypothetical protein